MLVDQNGVVAEPAEHTGAETPVRRRPASPGASITFSCRDVVQHYARHGAERRPQIRPRSVSKGWVGVAGSRLIVKL